MATCLVTLVIEAEDAEGAHDQLSWILDWNPTVQAMYDMREEY